MCPRQMVHDGTSRLRQTVSESVFRMSPIEGLSYKGSYQRFGEQLASFWVIMTEMCFLTLLGST